LSVDGMPKLYIGKKVAAAITAKARN